MSETKLPACPVELTISIIGSKWKVLVLRDLMGGTRRFGELKDSLDGVSQKVLSATLKDMESDGLLTRTAYNEIPPRVEYDLTDMGRSLQPMLDSMMVWGEEYRTFAQSRPQSP